MECRSPRPTDPVIGRWTCNPGRSLTPGERAIATEMFGRALDPDRMRIHHHRWWPFQPRDVAMAPDGDLWIAPGSPLWRDDYAAAPAALQALFVHELTHVWQHQNGIRLPLRRHPFCRYRYTLVPGRPLERYGIEQQAMIVQHAWERRRRGDPLGDYATLVEPFARA
jgi:hypothetical protein